WHGPGPFDHSRDRRKPRRPDPRREPGGRARQPLHRRTPRRCRIGDELMKDQKEPLLGPPTQARDVLIVEDELRLREMLTRAVRGRFKMMQPDLPAPDEEPMQFSAPSAPPEPDRDAPGGVSLEEMEQRHILAVLEKNRGNRSATAAELGISLRKLYYRLGQYQKQGLMP